MGEGGEGNGGAAHGHGRERLCDMRCDGASERRWTVAMRCW